MGEPDPPDADPESPDEAVGVPVVPDAAVEPEEEPEFDDGGVELCGAGGFFTGRLTAGEGACVTTV